MAAGSKKVWRFASVGMWDNVDEGKKAEEEKQRERLGGVGGGAMNRKGNA